MAKVNNYKKDEDLNVKLDFSLLKKAGKYISPYKKDLIITLCVVMINNVVAMANPFLTQLAFDHAIPNENVKGLIMIGIAMLTIMIVGFFTQKFRMKHMNIVGQGIIYDMRRDLFSHLQKLPFSYYDSRPHGKILVRVVNYVDSLADMFSNGIINVVMELFSIVVVLCYMISLSPKLTLISLVGLPVLGIVINSLKNIHRKAWQKYSDKNSNLNAYLHESINGVRITQAFVREKKNKRIFARLATDSYKTFMKAKSIEFAIFPTTYFLSRFTTCFIYFIAVGALTKDPAAYQIGMIYAMTSYISRFWAPISNLSNIYNSVMTNAAYLDRIFETLGEDIVIHDKENAYEMPDVKGDVEFKNVTFRYDKEDKTILENVSFKVNAGETIALVGPTGAGKTTVVNLLSRYYDIESGEILIDGHNIADVTVESLRSKLGYMLQDSFIFTGTIMDNIRYGRLNATDEEVYAATRAVNAEEFILNLADGYDTFVSECGSTLSAGQRQLISLARAMLRDPQILILDEATSSIDTETERKLIAGINKILEGRTSFVIAHRLSTIKNSDRIMVIGEKSVMECGTHDELMALKGKYYQLYTTQNRME